MLCCGSYSVVVVIAICKDTKLKAIHNKHPLTIDVIKVVIAICKDTKLKAIHNCPLTTSTIILVVIAICKDTKLKAIHNLLKASLALRQLLLLFAKILN